MRKTIFINILSLLLTVFIAVSPVMPAAYADTDVQQVKPNITIKGDMAKSYMDDSLEGYYCAGHFDPVVTITAREMPDIRGCKVIVDGTEYTNYEYSNVQTVIEDEDGNESESRFRIKYVFKDRDSNNFPALYPGQHIVFQVLIGDELKEYSYDVLGDLTNMKVNKGSGTAKFVYTGKAIKPGFSLEFAPYYNGKREPLYTLEKGKDYKEKITDNINVGYGHWSAEGTGNYMSARRLHFEIIPKGTGLVEVTSPKASSMKVKWKKQALKMSKNRITGYEIMCSTTKSFKKGTCKRIKVKGYKNTFRTIKILRKGKRYYVKIRTYMSIKNAEGLTDYHYSKWSGVKSVKVK